MDQYPWGESVNYGIWEKIKACIEENTCKHPPLTYVPSSCSKDIVMMDALRVLSAAHSLDLRYINNWRLIDGDPRVQWRLRGGWALMQSFPISADLQTGPRT